MGSQQDKLSRQTGNDDSHMTHNHGVAASQADRTAFRSQKVALSADIYNPQRIASYPKPIDV